jgi:nucleotide-binding universal stress UspA family protein
MYDQVLVPTDGSERAMTALAHGSQLASRYDATLHVIHVVETTGVAQALDSEQFEVALDRIERAGEDAIETLVANAQQRGIDDPKSAVLHGVPHEEIREYTETEDIDIVVMATAGRTGSEREVVGSVTERLVRTSPVPVLTVRENMDVSSV